MKTALRLSVALFALMMFGCGGHNHPCYVEDVDGVWTLQCDDGRSSSLSIQTCYVETRPDGTSRIVCPDGTSTDINNETCTITNNADGTSTINCSDGTSVVVGQREVAVTRGTIAPGASLSLSHSFSTPTITAQFDKDGRVFNIQDYPDMHTPDTGAPFAFADGQVIRRRNIHAWASPTDASVIVLYAQGHSQSAPSDDSQPPIAKIRGVNADGTNATDPVVLATPDRLGSLDTYRSNGQYEGEITGAGLMGGNTVIVHSDPNDAEFWIVDSDFVLSSGPTAIAGAVTGAHVDVTATPDGGFAILYMTAAGERRIQRYVAGGATMGAPIDLPNPSSDTHYQNNGYSLEALPSGGFAVIHDASIRLPTVAAEDEYIQAVFINAEGNVTTEQRLTASDTYRTCIAVAGNGNVLMSYETGGPDAQNYVVFDSAGNVLAGPDFYSELEAARLGCVAFNDNSFGLIFLEDETLVPTLQLVTNSGTLLPHQEHFGNPIPAGYTDIPAVGVSDYEFVMFYDPYYEDDFYPGQMVRVSKGILDLQRVSANEVRVTNQAAQSVDVTLMAVGSP